MGMKDGVKHPLIHKKKDGFEQNDNRYSLFQNKIKNVGIRILLF